jgi:hypothetical protein
MRRFGFLVGVLFFGFPNVSFAATAYSGACATPTAQVNAEKAISFLDQPPAFLANFADGGGALSSAIRDLVTTRPETLEGISSLSQAASPDQNRAIGAGLGTAAAICVLNQPATAMDIQAAVLKTSNEQLISAFVSITGDIPTSAVPGSDPTGESTNGGGQGNTSTPPAGGGVTGPSPSMSFSTGAAASTSSPNANNVFSAAFAAPRVVVSPVSPTN